MHAITAQPTRRLPLSLWVSIVLFVLYSALGIAVCVSLPTDPRLLFALLTVSPLLFIGMVVSVVDIVRTRKRGDAGQTYTRLQWGGLILVVVAMPLWLAIAILIVSLI
ncbi:MULTISPECIES: hypothetical protein [Cryobacterium]|uniref:DUF4190 domain-containing protein n=1 Tax=Cryobacterium levicorallinum TaxID=995038 RepID=A0A1I2ZLY7_9MICO|nr:MULTISPECIES: hypothetical protein [Cryobacterium]TFB89520.1 hypothetical protein E3O11_00475 [Cryobacterium levicorallinum]TFD56639.1 hypothetical protein E3T41_15780 [Cryobacterium sp. Hh38]GEP25857.1 hypothetical protein CLE01_04550 [Cryobacterium levicorallinum]SFH38121.1 hypothetical protein SAMN05216274_104103 [Cryobacterium levicorallinum]